MISEGQQPNFPPLHGRVNCKKWDTADCNRPGLTATEATTYQHDTTLI